MSFEQGMIPSRANPYQRNDSMYFPHDEQPKPVLTLTDLDAMVARCVEQARHGWYEEQRRACERAWEEGSRHGFSSGRAALGDVVTQVIRGRLNHTVRRLRDRMGHAKTTIKDERLFCEQMADEVAAAVQQIEQSVPDDAGLGRRS